MSVQAQNLGGRLPLLDPRDLSAAQREVYDRLNSTFVRWSDRIHFQSKTEDGKLIGPFNPILYSPGISLPFLDLHDAEEKQTSVNERVRQVVILAVGAVWQCEYELYAHAAAAKMAGISEDAVRLLITGDLPDDLSAEEKVAQRFARQLVVEHRVDAATYGAAEEAFGKQGLVDIAYLIGIYQLVCGLLSAFEIPVPNSQPNLDVSPSARISDRHPRQAELPELTTVRKVHS
jgi:4-carboxymuconolactone decarboxylase